MAYMDQERKSKLAPAIKAALDKYGVKATIAVRHHSTLVINIREGGLDFITNYNVNQAEKNLGREPKATPAVGSLDVNPYWFREHFTGRPLEFLTELMAAANEGNHNRSDLSSDYHDVGWYVDVNVGQWDRPYRCREPVPARLADDYAWQSERRLRQMEAGDLSVE